MIHDALSLIGTRLNNHLKSTFPDSDSSTVIGNLYHANGEHIERWTDHLVLFVANISLDELGQNARASRTGEPPQRDEPLQIDLNVMLVSNFFGESYREGLQLLSEAIRFFHVHPKFSRNNIPDMPATLLRLSIELADEDNLEKPQSRTYLSPDHRPYVLYRLKLFAA